MFLRRDAILRLTDAVLICCAFCAPASAISLPSLSATAGGIVFDSSFLVSGPTQSQNAFTGPLQSSIEAGLVLNYGPSYQLETTLYARGHARADYGVNGASVELNFRATNGTDRGTFPGGNFSGSLPFNSSIEPQAEAFSGWTDTFVINGGVGLGVASASVALHGHAESRYGANGTLWYDTETSFQLFGTHGHGSAQYALDIYYDAPPTGAPPEYAIGEYNQPIRWEQNYASPLPEFVSEIGVQPDILTGTFLFEYGVPFELRSLLSVTGYNQINVDFDHTATLSMFTLPDGASLTSGSGHVYPIAEVPEPSASVLLGFGIVVLIGCARKSVGCR